jgi:putative transposase
MARLPRISLEGQLHYVMQRGNNGQRIFETTADYQRMLDLLGDNAQRFKIKVHAYALGNDHFRLLLTPTEGTGISPFMQAVGRAYVRYFNALYQRTGTLWDGRYRSTLVQADRYALPCMVALDSAAAQLASADQAQLHYPWSSHAHYAGTRVDRWIAALPAYWELGNTPFAREAAYVNLVRTGLNAVQHTEISQALQGGWPLGTPEYVAELQKMTPRRLHPRKPGRPSNPRKEF